MAALSLGYCLMGYCTSMFGGRSKPSVPRIRRQGRHCASDGVTLDIWLASRKNVSTFWTD